eukprot:CAMPEP_0179361114 /NCGR_PEP_ID=MMETSP0797-20121207/80326_1 /TAXON_ID=47934 /ORGANISM="Dinophysis acuminata, Strain DAEP01" /LENGTH=149 /DNA_ID=CAMNT_0021076491 /DNA_START=69 /DNA_END=515 /DNA_ORIENTATION=+
MTAEYPQHAEDAQAAHAQELREESELHAQVQGPVIRARGHAPERGSDTQRAPDDEGVPVRREVEGDAPDGVLGGEHQGDGEEVQLPPVELRPPRHARAELEVQVVQRVARPCLPQCGRSERAARGDERPGEAGGVGDRGDMQRGEREPQ